MNHNDAKDGKDEMIEKQSTPTAAGMFNLAGQTLGKYRLVERIGQGGMAQVYRAYQADLDRYVAIKILHPHLTADEEFASRFQREARAIAALEHPNVVRVYDFDAAEGLAFLVMENVEGNSLKPLLRDLECRGERMELEDVARIVSAVADALDYAHRQGTVHRDVKASNVLLTADGRPVLTDFGIAHMVDATVITESGGTLGTPAYMSPEQGQGEPGDARSDVYALGVLLYQLCTGQFPFDADTPYAVILKHISAPLPPPRSINPDLPGSVERVIFKALAKDPDDRYQAAGDMGEALRAAIGSPGAPAPPPRRRRPGRRIAALAGAAAVVLVGIVLLSWPGSPLRVALAPPSETPPPTSAATPVPAPTPVPEPAPGLLELKGTQVVEDTWLNPDLPDDVWHDFDLVHLQGPLTPDRILLRFDLTDLPADATVVSAALSIKVELWGDQSLPGAAVVYRVLTGWTAEEATYNAPWSAPGLAAGVDYDSVPLDLVPVPDQGLLIFDVTRAFEFWHARGEANHGLVVMMSDDSHNQVHHWVYLSEQDAAADRPTLRVAYEGAP